METGGRKVLFDTGPGTMRRLLEAGHSVFDIDAVCYSHFHPDHTGELVPFLFSNKYSGTEKRQKPLTLVGGTGFSAFYKSLTAIYGPWMTPVPGKIELVEMATDAFDETTLSGLTLKTAPVRHKEESVAFRLESCGARSAVYSGDTDFSENLITLAKDADLLVCESALPDALKAEGHLTPSLAGEIAARAGARHLVLTHFYPECEKVDIAKECRRTYRGMLTLAEDLLTLRP